MEGKLARSRFGWLLLLGCAVGELAVSFQAQAQVVPDGSLGAEGSVLTPGVFIESRQVDLIDGGASRGNNLFHSFADFNVSPGQRLYFANPTAIENIVSRVTGGSGSNILGTLGVLGDANLFVINPNGILFGPNAELDVRGTFVASTADSVRFAGGYVFSATELSSPPLLTINSPVGLTSWLPQSGLITSAASLNVGEDAIFVAQNLSLNGQVFTGGDLALVAAESLLLTDSPEAPLILSAGNALLLQGNRSLAIDALAHPDSRVVSGNHATLRSDGSVVGDVYMASGGNITVERLNGQLGRLISPKDPVFEAAGDFAIDSFAGGSLQILAGGSVTIPGAVLIDSAGGPFNDSTVPLSNGGLLAVTGTTVPTLDIRAGTTGFFGTPTAGSPTSADISVGSITVPGGLVLLTNQYQPNPALTGDISVGDILTADFAGGGDVVVDSRGEISFNLIDGSGGDSITFDLTGNGGNVTLLAAGDIVMPFPSFILSYGLVGGSITLASNTAIIQEDGPAGIDPFALSIVESLNLGDVDSQPIRFTAPNISLGGNVFTTSLGPGKSGDIVFQGDALSLYQATIAPTTSGPGDSGNIQLGFDAINLEFTSFIGTATFSDSGGRAGEITVQVGDLSAVGGSQISSVAFGIGDAGNVTIAADSISLLGFQPPELTGGFFAPSGIFSSTQPGAEGNGGSLTIATDTLSITDAAAISTSSFGVGNAGQVRIDARESITVDGAVFTDFEVDRDSQPSVISSEIFEGGVGNGGEVILNTPVLRVTNGGTITSTADGDGSAGNVTITVTEAATFGGSVPFSAVGVQDRASSARVETTDTATGAGGTLIINAPRLAVTNGARLEATTAGPGQAGNIVLNIVDDLTLDGDNTGIFANTTPGSSGDGGSIFIDPTRIAVLNGAQISVASEGSGQAGSLFIQGGSLILNRGLISAETVSSTGGNITLNLEDVVVLLNNSRISTTAGTALAGGDGGNIDLSTTYLVASADGNNDITANAFSGAGGSVLITAEGIFGLTARSRSELESLLSTSDPVLLDPANLPSSDITAISRGNPDLQGEVLIQSPDIDPSQGAVPLPDSLVDASRLIAQGCSSGGAVAQEIGSLVVTGRGGLPPTPTDSLGSSQILLDWLPLATESTGTPAAQVSPTLSAPRQLVEVQSLVRDERGQVLLVADAAGGTAALADLPALTCSGEPSENQP